jgi:small-conductance mechanosensitive channel
MAIDQALREAGIEIPFPQRDLHLRSVSTRAAQAIGGRTDDDPGGA